MGHKLKTQKRICHFLLKYNPIHKKVPVLMHGEFSVAKPLVSLEYVNETWKNNPNKPQDPNAGGMARFQAKCIVEKVNFERSVQGQLVPTSNKKKNRMAFVRFCSFCGQCLKLLQAKRMGAKRPLEEASPQLKMLESQLKIPQGIWPLVGLWCNWSGIMQEAIKVELINGEFFSILHNWIAQCLALP